MNDGFFQSVVDAYYSDLFRFGLSLAKNPDDACDLVQETYRIFAEKGDQLRDTAKARQWLFTTLYRQFTASYHRSKRVVPFDSTQHDLPAADNQTSGARGSDQHTLLEALASLNSDQRSILTLFYINQLGYREIAASLDIPIGTVMSRLSRAKETLRARLNSDPAAGIHSLHRPSDPQKP